MKVVAIIPAHNEESGIATAVLSLKTQSVALARVLVVADNCTDNTVSLARLAGAEVLETVGNTEKKAGALNQGLDYLMPWLGDDDAILQMDADSRFEPTTLERMLKCLINPNVGGVSCNPLIDTGSGLLTTIQKTEYVLAWGFTGRRRGVPRCLSGVGTLVTVRALRAISAQRGSTLPGDEGQYYLPDNLTEDYELTIAIMQVGLELRAPRDAVAYTDVMPTWRDLWAQRVRWQRGTLETLWLYGRRTPKQWLEQVHGYLLLLLPFAMIAMYATIFATGGWHWNPIWLALIPFIAAAQALEVRQQHSWKTYAFAALGFPMWAFGIWRAAVYWTAAWRAMRHTAAQWQ